MSSFAKIAGLNMLASAGAGGVMGALNRKPDEDYASSVLRGGMYGATAGAFGSIIQRYAGAGMRRASRSGMGMGFTDSVKDYARLFSAGARRQGRLDWRDAKLVSNQPINAIRSSLKGIAGTGA